MSEVIAMVLNTIIIAVGVPFAVAGIMAIRTLSRKVDELEGLINTYASALGGLQHAFGSLESRLRAIEQHPVRTRIDVDRPERPAVNGELRFTEEDRAFNPAVYAVGNLPRELGVDRAVGPGANNLLPEDRQAYEAGDVINDFARRWVDRAEKNEAALSEVLTESFTQLAQALKK